MGRQQQEAKWPSLRPMGRPKSHPSDGSGSDWTGSTISRAVHGPAKTAEVGEVLMRLADSPFHVYPGQAVPGAPSHLLRYVETGGVRIDFLVTRPIIANGLRLIAVTTLV